MNLKILENNLQEDELCDDIEFISVANRLNIDVEKLVVMCRQEAEKLNITPEDYLETL